MIFLINAQLLVRCKFKLEVSRARTRANVIRHLENTLWKEAIKDALFSPEI